MIKAVIFDMDGLLVDSEPFWRKAHMAVVAEEGFSITEDDMREMAGKGTDHVVAEWGERFNWDSSKNPDITERVVRSVILQVTESGRALPGVYELIETIKQHDIPMAVASSSMPELIEVTLKKLDIEKSMNVIRSACDEKNSKPFPDVYLTVARMLDVDPSTCLVFEDAFNGVRAAKAAGMRCVAVPESPYDPARFTEADMIVNSLEAIDWITIQNLMTE
jgi:HAD superfamily hydrolase (TIGR01509 family)